MQATYVVPTTFDVDMRAFGPLSGLTRERRLLAAYEAGALEPHRRRRAGSGATGGPTPMCTLCGCSGHWGRDCRGAVEDDAWAAYRRRAEAAAAAELAYGDGIGGAGTSLTLTASSAGGGGGGSGRGGRGGGDDADIPSSQAIVLDE